MVSWNSFNLYSFKFIQEEGLVIKLIQGLASISKEAIWQNQIVKQSTGQAMAILGLINGMGGKEEMVTDKRDLREKANKSKCGPCLDVDLNKQTKKR